MNQENNNQCCELCFKGYFANFRECNDWNCSCHAPAVKGDEEWSDSLYEIMGKMTFVEGISHIEDLIRKEKADVRHAVLEQVREMIEKMKISALPDPAPIFNIILNALDTMK